MRRKFFLLILMTSLCSLCLAAPKPVHASDGGKGAVNNGGDGGNGGLLIGNGGSGGAGGYDDTASKNKTGGSAGHHRHSGTGHAHSSHSDH